MLHQIGAGVLGPVFRAYQPAPGRLVAVKQFRLGLPPEQGQRFVAALDQIVAADLTHPGVAAPIAAGLTDATPYLALDFVAAESFDVVMREYGPGQVKDVLHLTRQLSGALDAAAASGVVHGALHPRDVLMAADDVRMTGLGIAQALEGIGLAAPIRRPYAAPERTAGAPWDHRSDIFSLAALAYEMLAGRRVLAAGRVSAEQLPTIDGADIDRLRVVFAKALAERPADRFEHAREFADALERALTQPGRVRSARRRRQSEPVADSLQELPLDIELNSPPVVSQGDVHPPLEIGVLDAALPQSRDAAQGEPELTLIEAGRGELDLAGLDTRLDALVVSPPPELELHAIEADREPVPARIADDAERPGLRLDVVDATTERSAAARFIDEPNPLEVDTEAIKLSADPLPRHDDVWPDQSDATPSLSLDDRNWEPALDLEPKLELDEPELALEAAPAPVPEPAVESEAEPEPERRPEMVAPFIEVVTERAVTESDRLEWDDARTDTSPALAHAVVASESESEPEPESGPVSRTDREVFAGTLGRTMPAGYDEPSRSGNWPIVLGVAFGLLVGFAFGYGIGQSRLSGGTGASVASTSDAPSEPSTSTRQLAAPAASAGAPAPGGAAASAAPAASTAPAPTSGTPAVQPSAVKVNPPAEPKPATTAPGAQPSQKTVAAKTPAEQRLVIRTTPAGSRVTIDGKDAGLTPLTVALAQGTHVVRLAHQGYSGAERRVRIGTQPAQPIDLELVARPAREVAASPATPERASGALVIDSRPTGARVFVDEALVGTTPLTIDAIASGDHKVRFEMDGFGPWSATAKITAGGKTRVSGSLER